MIKLRPLLVLTGTMHVEGGARDEKRKTLSDHGEGKERVTTSITREVTRERRQADSVVTGYIRRFSGFRLLKTPFGTLVDPEQITALKAMFVAASKAADDFNARSTLAKLTNCYLWEPLWGERKTAIENWISRRVAAGDPDVVKALPLIEQRPAPVVASAAPVATPAPTTTFVPVVENGVK